MESQKIHNKKFSFEFFPPKSDEAVEKLREVRNTLSALKPDYFSVTFGAGGSTRDRTLETALEIQKTGFDAAPHISCIASTKTEIKTLLEQYVQVGIRHIVALRGDLPSGSYTRGDLAYASSLINFIRETTDNHFYIEVAAYPECHPQAKSLEDDIQNLKRKLDAGANSAITQYFFNADAYFRFVNRCEQIGVKASIVPGIMPITNFTKLARFSDACGAEIPRWIRKQLEAYGDDSESIRKFGLDVISALCQRLLDAGAPGLHLYTMNQSAAAMAIWKHLGLV